jgi:hypothetical protein
MLFFTNLLDFFAISTIQSQKPKPDYFVTLTKLVQFLHSSIVIKYVRRYILSYSTYVDLMSTYVDRITDYVTMYESV